MPSAAVAFSVPGKDPKDLREFSDFASFLSYAYSTERIPDDKVKFHPKYAKFGVLKHRGLTYMLQMMSVSDDDLFMLISVHKRTMGKYEKRSKIEVNGYPGLQAERTKEGGAIDVWRSWTAADRFYAMTVEGIPEGPDGIENARRFIESVRMLDRP